MNEPRFTDFKGIASEIREQPAFAELGKLIERVALAQSCIGDLAEAQSCVDALLELRASPRKRGTMNRQTTEGALLRTGLLLYQRATTGGKGNHERGSIDIRASLTPGQQDDHDAIVEVRHRTIGHVIPGEVDGQHWHRSFLLGLEEGPAWQPTVITNRVQWSRRTFERLARQLPIAMEKMMTKFDKALSRLVDMLNKHPIPAEIYDRHIVDNVATFGSVAKAREIAASRRQRRVSILG